MGSGEIIRSATAAPAPSCAAPPAYVLALEAAASYLPPQQHALLRQAWLVGAAAHAGQMRKSGEPYITHPVAVAGVLAELKMDVETLVAAILHDTIEDTPLGFDDIAAQFGQTVAELVEGVTKLDKLQFASRQEADAESFRKMLLAMARDLRVILIKLADRLHNMRTLGAQKPESRRRIARETLEIHAPIAQRLGMNMIKAELQDLGFKALYPARHAALQKRINSQPLVRREALAMIEAKLAQRLSREEIEFKLVSRVKTPWSIYQKMRAEHKSFEQVMDVFGLRVIVTSVADCYHALGVAHGAFKPLDARFRDFVAIPKANGYQSLHTVLFGPYGSPIEVQIRTDEMDLVAERGIAAHWSYKQAGEGSNSAQHRAHAWIANLVESQQAAGSSLEFLENVKVDLFPDEVYLFTPKGDILALPRNSTAVDFAYAVHTDVGNHAVMVRVDGKLVPLKTKLNSGQRVEIVTAKASAPKAQWLEFVVTGKARAAIRAQLKQIEHEDAVQFGHRMLDRELESLGTSLDRVLSKRIETYLAEARLPRLESLLADIALGNRMPAVVARALSHEADNASAPAPQKIMITGHERGIITFANCCMPIPGDTVMGYHSAGKGIVVHRMDCANVPEFRKSPERWVDIGWDREVHGDFRAALRVDVDNRPGVLAQLAAAIAKAEANIDAVDYLDRDNHVSTIRFAVDVRSTEHMDEVLRRLRRLAVVHGCSRL